MPDTSPFANPGPELWSLLGWSPDAGQLRQLIQLQQLLQDWNSRVNLTRLVQGEDFWIAQVLDSLWPLLPELMSPDTPRRCIDVGTGGGFPGLAVAIALPGAELTLVDSVGRKTAAVAAMAKSLGLGDRVLVRTERVERTGHEQSCRGTFDLAMARAVGAAPVVAEYLVPLLRRSGEALLYRGRWNDADETELQSALQLLKARSLTLQRMELPSKRGARTLIRIGPEAETPRTYPRATGMPSKMPLGVQDDDSRS
ncbi:16S rRNA (guanine(527)-N(7))-methyltransferase RsmG [Synechococcus sp. UW179A]|uniref:16S rRNA (guanine(527)-N(7))-methyltransferase RsmG n=1 Tax=Synechococcus sp. UW179A TaxID=2575510 RepID=UPI000E0E1F08|nr:16S rRNA (guanine(527)-N(7))-methyltransferase RsmG [Synechococcus sp. UW179A]